MRKWFISNVLPGFWDVFANPRLRVSIFISDDLPTFDLPIKAYSGTLVSGHCSTFELLISYLAFFISMLAKLINIFKIRNQNIKSVSEYKCVDVSEGIVKSVRVHDISHGGVRCAFGISFHTDSVTGKRMAYPCAES